MSTGGAVMKSCLGKAHAGKRCRCQFDTDKVVKEDDATGDGGSKKDGKKKRNQARRNRC